ncbi:hypothetical protein E3U55_15345 [Filobacillus milosensis]|uniref:Uncharacterized protein n=1 Tax=Filobacillus milosensis TaxID=94137 RepID=A0A4Y8IF68_9BACI|nr:hypothetical protein [Filobacillus milosensis]TFB13777.1 hypothetical protein E3U55_15345 [Filobacillus milosensis]
MEVAQAVDKKVKLKDVTLEKVEENEDGSIDYDYMLEINYYDEESEEIIEKAGELTITNDDGWQIIRDWEKITKFEKEAMRKYLEEQSKGNGSKNDETDE